MAEPMLYHRAPAFVELYARAGQAAEGRLPDRERRADVRRPAARARWSRPSRTSCARHEGARLLAGKFGERWIELCEAYGADLVATSPAGASASTRRDRPLLAENDGVEVVFATLSETSTGVVNDVQAIAEVAHAHGAILAVDAVSGLGAAELRQDEWGVDVVVAGSQKALMCPPGLGFASSPSARSTYAAERAARRPLLLRLGQDREGPAQGPADSPFTPAVTLFMGSTSRST
jgi:aspartate aminotransferase-like enzyme